MVFPERAEQLALLENALGDVLGGRGQVVTVTGPVGSGKTELTHQFAALAAERGVRVVRTHASPGEVGPGLGIFGQILESCPSADELRARLTSSGETLSPQLMLSVCHDLLRSASRRPLLLIADDVHLTDADSLSGLLYLVRHSRSAPVMLVLVAGEYSQQTIPLFHAELLREPHHRQIQLPLLSVRGVAAVLAERLGEAAAQRLAPAAHAVAGGNPLVVRALLEEHLSNHQDPLKEALDPGEASAMAVLACLHHSGVAGLEVARAHVLLGRYGTPELRSELTSLPRRVVDHFTESLREAGLLREDGQLRHPAAAAAVMHDLDLADTSTVRLRAAELLHGEGACPLAIAQHLAAADRLDRPWHVSLLRRAAEEALDRRESGLALQYLDLALRESRDDEERALITAAKVRVEWLTNPARAMPHFAALLSAFDRGQLPDLDAVILARALTWHGREEESAAILSTISSREHAPEVRRALHTTAQSLRSTHPDSAVVRWEQRTAPPAPGLEPAAPLPDEAVMWEHLRDGDHAAAARLAEDLLYGDQSPDYWRGPRGSAVCVLVYAHELDRAQHWTTLFFQDAEPGFRTWHAVQATVLAEVARRRGDLPEASHRAQEALRLMSPRAWGPQIELPLASLISAATAMGHLSTAADWLAFPRPEDAPKTRYHLHYLEARGHHHLAEGRYLPALRDFMACGGLMESWDMDIAAVVPWRLGVAEALLGLGQLERAAELLDCQEARPGAAHPRVRGTLLRLRAGTVKPREAVDLLRKAAEVLDTDELPVELLAALIDLNRVYVELGDSHRARFTARRVWQIAAQCGAEARVRAALLPEFSTARTGAGTPPATKDTLQSVLSEAELRVAEQAARGYTNREIADRLFITVSTVEQHLTRVYRKLQVGGRSDLQSRVSPHLRGTA
ncbi:AAA family ATPase [Streptomyces sp. TLI_146]|uniref:AAA family ATPase n=1 Tax=Streptomyces sp. TLI_146 TaxID=1938858 RepID=UPI000CC04A52|nr:AAA family ATPase [Streptomyces sp. TLI_146]PKV77062.1 regulatory LuxR family protein [Streptomyces sp. TLI_146]